MLWKSNLHTGKGNLFRLQHFPDVLSINALISKLNMSDPDLPGNSKTAPKNTNKLWSKINFVGFAKWNISVWYLWLCPKNKPV